MLEVLENYIKNSWRRRPLKGTKAGLNMLRSDKKLKKRDKEQEKLKREKNKITLTTMISKKRDYEEAFPDRMVTPHNTKQKRYNQSN